METLDVMEDSWIMDSNTLKIMESLLNQNMLIPLEMELVNKTVDLKNLLPTLMLDQKMLMLLPVLLLNNQSLLPLMPTISNSMVEVSSVNVVNNLITELLLLDILLKPGLLKTLGDHHGVKVDILD